MHACIKERTVVYKDIPLSSDSSNGFTTWVSVSKSFELRGEQVNGTVTTSLSSSVTAGPSQSMP